MLLYFLLLTIFAKGSLDYHIAPDTNLSINLPLVVQTKNYSCSVQGKYNISTLTQPAFLPGLSLLKATTKPLIGNTSILAVFNKTLYASSGNALVLYNLTILSNPTNTITLQYAQSPILTIQPTSGLLGSFLVSVEGNGLLRTINLTDNSELVNIRLDLQVNNPIFCVFVQDLNYWWAFLYNSSNVYVVKFQFDIGPYSSLYRVLSTGDFQGCSEFLALNVYRNIFYVCDSLNGVFTYTLSPVIYTLNGAPGFIMNFQHPVLFGQINSCDLSQTVLTICTDTAILIYQIPFLTMQDMYGGKYKNGKTSGNWAATYTEDRFQVFNLALNSLQSPIFDGFNKVNYWIFYGNYLIASDEASLFIYSLQNPTLFFPSQSSDYEYQGTLLCAGLSSDVLVLASYSSGLFDFRGESENSGFLQPESFQNFTFGAEFHFDIPISNYISGNNISYSIQSQNGTAQVCPFYSSLQEFQFPLIDADYVQKVNSTIIVKNNQNIFVILINGNYSQMYSGYVTQLTNTNKITCLALYEDKVIYEYIDSKGRNIQELKSNSGQLLFSIYISELEPCYKMLVSSNILIVQRTTAVNSYNISLNSIALKSTLTFVDNLDDIALCTNLCILFNNTIAQYSLPNLNLIETLFIFTEPVSQILSSESFIIAVSSSYFYCFSWPSMSYSLFPLVCAQSEYSLSNQYLSVLCDKYYLIDLFSQSFSSIMAAIPNVTLFTLDRNSSDPSLAVGVSKQNLVLFSIDNNLSSNLLPTNNKLSSIWASVDIPDNFQTLNSQINIIAYNGIEEKNKTIELNLINARYIEVNSSFDPSSNQLTSGLINVKTQNFSEIVPSDSFIGNNLTYYLQYDDDLVYPTDNCSNYQYVCIENKNFIISYTSSKLPVSDFCINGDTLITSSEATLSVYNISVGSPEFKYSFRFIDSSKKVYQCLLVFLLSDNNSLICSGVYSSSSSIGIYYIISGSINGTIYEIFQISYQPQWLSVSEKSKKYIYLYEGVGLYYLELLPDKTLYLLNYYSAASLGTQFFPISAEYYNETSILIGDKYKGVCLLYSNSMAQLIELPSNSSVIDLFLMNSYILVLTESGEGYLLDFSATIILNYFHKLYPTGYIPGNMQGSVNEDLSLAVFPIYTSDYMGYLRVLNYITGEIYTDIYISQFGPHTYFRRIIVIDKGFPMIFHDLSTIGGSIPLVLLGIRNEMTAYVKSVDRKESSYLKLVASVGDNFKSFGQVKIEYPKINHDNSDGSGSSKIYEKWWFWLIISIGIIGIITTIGLVYWCVIRKKKQNASFSHLIIND